MVRKAKVNKKEDVKSVDISEELKELLIEGFKQFKEVRFNDFGKINIFFGPNNSGKSTILESIFLLSCGFNITPGINQLISKRDANIKGFYDFGDRIINIFNEKDKFPYRFSLKPTFENNKKYQMDYTFNPVVQLSALDPRNLGNNDFFDKERNNNFIETLPNTEIPSFYVGNMILNMNNSKKEYELRMPPLNQINEQPLKIASMHDILAHRDTRNDYAIYSQLKRYSIMDKFIKEMKKIFPIIQGIDYIPYPDGNAGTIYIQTTDGKNLPMSAFGDGMRRWFYLLGRMIVNPNSIHCIEEIDSTIHHTAQGNFTKNLVDYSKNYNNQLFITCHSIEFADEFLESLYGENGYINENDEDIVRIYTIKPSEKLGCPNVWKLTGREAYEKRIDFGLELR